MSNSTVKNLPTDDQTAQTPPVVVPTDQAVIAPSGTGRVAKEQEPGASASAAFEEEKKLMASIKTTAETADKQALEALQGTLAETKRATFEAELPPDVEDAGVVSLVKAAEDVVVNGASLQLPISEEEYAADKKTKISGKSDIKRNVFGVSSVAALAIWVGKMLKIAHRHAKRVLWKGDEKDAN